MTDPYLDREQTKAKHFILRRYLQALAFKVLRFSDITYIDGFSGPWETKTEDFIDSSFMIAINVLKDAQQIIQTQTKRRPRIRCFFSESNRQAYGTKSREGLKAFRDTEYGALKINARDRADAKERKRESRSGVQDLFSGVEADFQETTIDEIVEEQKVLASAETLNILREFGPVSFSGLWEMLLQAHMLRVTNVKDICVDLADVNKIERTWGGGNRKPSDQVLIRLKAS